MDFLLLAVRLVLLVMVLVIYHNAPIMNGASDNILFGTGAGLGLTMVPKMF